MGYGSRLHGLELQSRSRYPTHGTAHPIQAGKQPDKTFEEFLVRVSRTAATKSYNPLRIDYGGHFNGEVRQVITVTINPKVLILMFHGLATNRLPKIVFDLGIKVAQSRFEVDRKEPYAFVLAVEDCVMKSVTLAARRRQENYTQLVPHQEPRQPTEPVFQ